MFSDLNSLDEKRKRITTCRLVVLIYLLFRLKKYTVKKVREFPVFSRDVTIKLSLRGNNDVITELFLPRGSLVSDIPAGDGKLVNLFLRCTCIVKKKIRKTKGPLAI